MITLLSKIPDQEQGSTSYDTDLVVVDSNNGEIISHLFEERAFIDDAMLTDSINIDTAPYQLNSTTRAFGIRFHKKNLSKYDNYSGEVLNLYYLEDIVLRPVLKGLIMDESTDEWLEECSGKFRDFERTLEVDKKQQNGFNNLKINETLTNSKLIKVNRDDCSKIVENVKKKSLIIKYDGNKYKIPDKYMW